MTDQGKSWKLWTVGDNGTCVIFVPDGTPLLLRHLSAAVLLSYRRFQTAVMEQTGYVFRHECENRADPKDAWLTAVAVARVVCQEEEREHRERWAAKKAKKAN